MTCDSLDISYIRKNFLLISYVIYPRSLCLPIDSPKVIFTEPIIELQRNVVTSRGSNSPKYGTGKSSNCNKNEAKL